MRRWIHRTNDFLISEAIPVGLFSKNPYAWGSAPGGGGGGGGAMGTVGND